MDLSKMNIEELEGLKAKIDAKLKSRSHSKKVIVTIKKRQESGRRESWLKSVDAVDDTKKGGYAFSGNFLESGEHELEVGTIIIECAPRGSVKNWWKEGIIYKVLEDGTLETLIDNINWYKEAVSFRNEVASHM